MSKGRTLIGAGTGTDSRGESLEFILGQTGGEYKHVLTVNELASHTHIQNPHSHSTESLGGWGAGSNNESKWRSDQNSPAIDWPNLRILNTTATNQNTGDSQPHNNLQPYIVTYMWKRIS